MSTVHGGGPRSPLLRRAREWHLYDSTGTRFIDFEQRDGLALLGHRPSGLGRVVKNELDRGLWTAAASHWDGRLSRAVAYLLAITPPRLGWVVDRLRLPHMEGWSVGGAGASESPQIVVWRPGLEADAYAGAIAGADLLELRLPVPLEPAPRLYAALSGLGAEVLDDAPCVAVSPIFAAAYAHVAARVGSAAVGATLQQRIGLARSLPLAAGWSRCGLYLRAPLTVDDANWARWRDAAATAGVLVPVDRRAPVIVPGVLTAHELTLWRRLSDAC